MLRYLVGFGIVLCTAAPLHADVPKIVNHQGVVSVDGVRFDGDGDFRFAIVDPDPVPGAPTILWSNDGSITGAPGGIPSLAISLTVDGGVYSVSLGDTSLTNMTEEISPLVFNDDNAVLRIWFDDGVNGLQQLAPDHKLTTSPYSYRLPNIFTDDKGNVGIGTTTPEAKLDVDGEIKGFGIVPIGSIIAWHKNFGGGLVPALPNGWLECDGVTVIPDGRLAGQTMPGLNPQGRFLRGSGTSGTVQSDATALPNAPFSTSSPGVHSHLVDRTGPGGPLLGTVEGGGSSGDQGSVPTQVAGNHNHSITVGGDSETRPVNMSVVWIMRVK